VLHQMLSENLIKRSSFNKKNIELANAGYQKLKANGLTEEQTEENLDYERNLELFNLLREARKKASVKFMQTPPLICPDEILKDIASLKPKNKEEILSLKGFNPRMFNKLGDEFLQIINNFSELNEAGKDSETQERKKALPENIAETYKLLSKGYGLKDIASLRKLSEPVISMQIETILQYDPETDVSILFPPELLDKIIKEIKKGYLNLKDLKSRFAEDIGYPLLRIAAAKYKASNGSEKSASPISSSVSRDNL
ncbi:MAG TPA: HRDC domain-containing protein, partial [Ignavibacteriaceae bacterium]|nr:HRDC domain-containing protein [Ignavibacteriaceae bacterium]